MRLLPLLTCLAMLSGCTGTEPAPSSAPTQFKPSAEVSAETATGESAETAEPGRACPAELFQPRPADGAELGEIWLCKYTTRDTRRELRGGVLLSREQAGGLRVAARRRPGGVVRCCSDPSRPAYTVADRTARGERRFVTVDFSVCATLSVYVGDRFTLQPTSALTSSRHQRLLVRFWRDAPDSLE